MKVAQGNVFFYYSEEGMRGVGLSRFYLFDIIPLNLQDLSALPINVSTSSCFFFISHGLVHVIDGNFKIGEIFLSFYLVSKLFMSIYSGSKSF